MEEDTLYYKAKLPYTDKAPKAGETPFFLVILLLIFFPPAAWYIMWKEKHYHRWYAWLIGLYGLLTIIGSLIMRLVLIPYSDRLYASLGLEQPEISPFSYVDYYVYLGIAEIILAGVLYFVSRKYTVFPRTWLIVGLLGLAFNSLIQPITQVYLTYTAYNNLVEQTRVFTSSVLSPTPSQSTPITSSNTQTSDWKTYTNEKYLWEIQYPSDYLIEREFEVPISERNGFDPISSIRILKQVAIRQYGDSHDDFFTLSINILTKQTSMSLKDFTEKRTKTDPVAGPPIRNSFKKIQIKELEAYEVNMSGSGDVPNWTEVYIAHPNSGYIVQMIFSYAGGTNYPQVFGRIITTFKFLN